MQKTPRRIVVFGANGGIGGQVVRQALDAGDRVTAVIRDGVQFGLAHAVDVVRVPGLEDPALLGGALEGADAVISGVGPRGRKDGPVASTSTHGILSAMQTAGIGRFVAVSAVPVGPAPEHDSMLNKHIILPLIGRLFRDIYADLAVMEDDIQRSGIDWTIMRPPKLVDGPPTGNYRKNVGGNVPRGYKISRANVAHAMLAALNETSTVRQVVGVAD